MAAEKRFSFLLSWTWTHHTRYWDGARWVESRYDTVNGVLSVSFSDASGTSRRESAVMTHADAESVIASLLPRLRVAGMSELIHGEKDRWGYFWEYGCTALDDYESFGEATDGLLLALRVALHAYLRHVYDVSILE